MSLTRKPAPHASLQDRRVALYLSRPDLAELAGVSARTIYSVESGSTEPSAITLRRIEDALVRAETERGER
jgi:predicted transcriptional regulator